MNKQIEEMAKALHESQHEFDKAWHECLQNKGKRPERENVFYAKYLVEKKGYRKASEVEKELADWKAIAEQYQKQFEDCYEEKKKIASDVAAEVFAEIEKATEHYISKIKEMEKNLEGISEFYGGAITASNLMLNIIAKLKKKYIGEQE